MPLVPAWGVGIRKWAGYDGRGRRAGAAFWPVGSFGGCVSRKPGQAWSSTPPSALAEAVSMYYGVRGRDEEGRSAAGKLTVRPRGGRFPE